MMDESEIADARAAPQNPETHMRTLAADLVHDPRPAEMPPDVEGTPFERIMAAQTLPQLYSLTDEFAKLKVDEPTMTEIRKAFSERRDEIKAAVEDEHPAEQWVPEEEDGDGDGTE